MANQMLANGSTWFLVLTGITLAALVVALVALLRCLGLARRLRRLDPGGGWADSIAALQQISQRTANLEALATALQEADQDLAKRVAGRLRPPGVVRFNAFAHMGSDLSYAVALIDDGGNGVVLSAVQGREDGRVYAKPVVDGASSYLLTPEEKQAIEIAGSREFSENM